MRKAVVRAGKNFCYRCANFHDSSTDEHGYRKGREDVRDGKEKNRIGWLAPDDPNRSKYDPKANSAQSRPDRKA